jgi:hypothetical protein
VDTFKSESWRTSLIDRGIAAAAAYVEMSVSNAYVICQSNIARTAVFSLAR